MRVLNVFEYRKTQKGRVVVVALGTISLGEGLPRLKVESVPTPERALAIVRAAMEAAPDATSITLPLAGAS